MDEKEYEAIKAAIERIVENTAPLIDSVARELAKNLGDDYSKNGSVYRSRIWQAYSMKQNGAPDEAIRNKLRFG